MGRQFPSTPNLDENHRVYYDPSEMTCSSGGISKETPLARGITTPHSVVSTCTEYAFPSSPFKHARHSVKAGLFLFTLTKRVSSASSPKGVVIISIFSPFVTLMMTFYISRSIKNYQIAKDNSKKQKILWF